LGDALVQADEAAITGCQHEIAAASRDFHAAAAAAATGRGDTLDASRAVTLMTALARCRRLGFSLSLLLGTSPAPADSPRGYSPVGRPVVPADGGTFLTARG